MLQKPPNCNCRFPKVVLRNGSGHDPSCPVHLDWEKEAHFVAKPDATKPPLSLLVKLGSIAVHADELTSPGAHEFDVSTIRSLLSDAEVRDWIGAMTSQAFLPVKRS